MVVAAGPYQLVAGRAAGHRDALEEAELGEQRKGAIDARRAYALLAAAKRADELVSVQAAAASAQRVDDSRARSTRAVPVFAEHRERVLRPT